MSSHHHVYLLRSTVAKHGMSTYIGYTVNPQQRLRKHNGLIVGGAKRTKIRGRPWEIVAVVHGFADHKTGLQFEWALQNAWKCRQLKTLLPLAEQRKLKSKRGAAVKLKCLFLLLHSDSFRDMDLTLYFPKQGLMDLTRENAFTSLLPMFNEAPDGIGVKVSL